MTDKVGKELNENINQTLDGYGTVAYVLEIEGEKYYVTTTGTTFQLENGTPKMVSENNPLPIKPYGKTVPLYGKDTSTRPDANEVEIGQAFVEIDNDFRVTVSNGTEWREI